MLTPVVCLFAAALLDAEMQILNQLKRATELQSQGQYSAAAELYRSALEATGPETESMIPVIHSGLASVYQDLGRFDDAEKEYLRALQLFRARKQQHERLAIHTLVNLGSLYSETQQVGRFRETCRSAEEVLDALEEVTIESARLHHLLSIAARVDGRGEEARQRLQHAIAIWRTMPGDHRLRLGDAYNSLGALFFAAEDYRAALTMFEEALTCFRSRGVHADRNTAGALANLACTYLYLNKRDMAWTAYGGALAALEQTVGTRHHSLAQTMTAYAVALEKVGMRKEAKAERKRAEAIFASATEQTASSQHVVDVVELQGHQ